MSVPAVLGVQNDPLNMVLWLLLIALVAIWLSLVWWTYADARRRIDDPVLVACAVGASLFPFIGTVVYAIVRPPETLLDRHEREVEVAAAEARLRALAQLRCSNCGADIERAFLRCPHCLAKLRDPCPSCRRPLDPRWQICPYCEADLGVGGAVAAPSRRRGQRTAAARLQRGGDARAVEGGTERSSAAPLGPPGGTAGL
ncbi:zinc ribbon domain-containing protein [Thermoleophilum album]|uniref:zinc ribbon domain-containing protein n=1 Tax=Thermoleophilum album TaxID=29539 RepID=UPI0019A6A562|nr:zinc ribbon domain-containing protein [Thermoleophilum album]WDT93000.1 zinc ribbon domain-containing protein [Thermoleophilum album]